MKPKLLTAQSRRWRSHRQLYGQVTQLAKPIELPAALLKRSAHDRSVVSGGAGVYPSLSGANQTVTLSDGATLDDLRFAIQ